MTREDRGHRQGAGGRRDMGSARFGVSARDRGRRPNGRGEARGRAGQRGSSYDEARRRREGRRGEGKPWGLMLLAGLFAVVAMRLVWLQLIEGPSLSARAQAISTNQVTLSARRGTIYDRNGNVLAMSQECRTLYCNPKAIVDKATAATVLADKLGGEASDYYDTLSKDTTFAYVKRQVDTSVAKDVLSELSSKKIDGVYALTDMRRVYPYGAVAGQILGFIGTDGHGLSGLELQYDDVLSGTDGEMTMERGLDGNPIAGGAYDVTEATDGTDIVVSLDANIQQKAEEQLTTAVKDAEAHSGNVIVTDPSTGEILAAASTPLYDPTDASTLTNDALKLSSVTDAYEPGSTFKILTMAIGYDTGTINQNSTFTVPAKVKVGDDLVGDDDGRSETMNMTPAEIMRRSSNAGAAMVGQAIGADKYSAGIARFGIGSKTGIDFPGEQAGIVTQRADYTGATLGAMSFGQSVAFPSIQLVRAVGAVANKGVITTPHFLVQKGGEEVSWPAGEQVVSEEAARLVTQDMVGVVQDGTGKKAQITGYSVAGKTGTGEQAAAEGGYEGGKLMSSFIGFANSDDPKVLVYVGVYGTVQHGSTAAAPAFSAIMSEALTDLGVKASE